MDGLPPLCHPLTSQQLQLEGLIPDIRSHIAARCLANILLPVPSVPSRGRPIVPKPLKSKNSRKKATHDTPEPTAPKPTGTGKKATLHIPKPTAPKPIGTHDTPEQTALKPTGAHDTPEPTAPEPTDIGKKAAQTPGKHPTATRSSPRRASAPAASAATAADSTKVAVDPSESASGSSAFDISRTKVADAEEASSAIGAPSNESGSGANTGAVF
jgi:hypothetical protein